MSSEYDPLWVPIISHYTDRGELDAARCIAQLEHISQDVWQYLIGGTTGDGWDLSDVNLDAWLHLCSSAMQRHQTFLVGALGPDTDAVIAKANRIEAHFRNHPSKGKFVGLVLCAPVDSNASQDAIADHFAAIINATTASVAIYQLPQVTGCSIAPETFARIAEDRRVILFKDTSGTDTVAASGLTNEHVFLVRGAEQSYARHLKPLGPYDGWLLSTANYLAPELREIIAKIEEGELAAAAMLSDALDVLVETVFAGAQLLERNAFADASRAGDHIRAYGSKWRSAPPPRRADGSARDLTFVKAVEESMRAFGIAVADGYRATGCEHPTVATSGEHCRPEDP